MLPDINEVWRIIPSHCNYSVSSWGRVKRMSSGRILKPYIHRYKYVGLSSKSLAVRTIHSLVAEVFIGDRASGMEVNHKNGHKTDNRVENLEYTTRRGNAIHAIKSGLMNDMVGERNSLCKLSERQVRDIFEETQKGVCPVIIAKRYNVTPEAIRNIRGGRSWKHLNLKSGTP